MDGVPYVTLLMAMMIRRVLMDRLICIRMLVMTFVALVATARLTPTVLSIIRTRLFVILLFLSI